jgi:hypothetical protein
LPPNPPEIITIKRPAIATPTPVSKTRRKKTRGEKIFFIFTYSKGISDKITRFDSCFEDSSG